MASVARLRPPQSSTFFLPFNHQARPLLPDLVARRVHHQAQLLDLADLARGARHHQAHDRDDALPLRRAPRVPRHCGRGAGTPPSSLASTAPTTVQRSSPLPPSQPQSFGSHCWGAEWGLLVAALADGADPNRRVWIDVRRPVVANVVQRSSRAGASVAGSVGLAWCEADPALLLFACRSLPCASGRAGPATRTRAAHAVWVG